MPPGGGMRLKSRGEEKMRKGVFSRLIKDIFKKHKLKLIIVMVCLALNSVSNFSVTIFINDLTNALAKYVETTSFDPWPTVIKSLLLMASFYAVGVITSFAWSRTSALLTQDYMNDLRIATFNHMQTLPVKYFDTHPHGDIMSIYTNDVDTLRQLISQALPTLFQSIVMVVSLFFIMLYFSLILTGIVVLGGIFMVINTKIVGGNSAKFFVKQQVSLGAVEGYIQESIKGLKVIKVFNHEEKSIEDFKQINNQLYKHSYLANKNSNILTPIMMNIGNILYVLIAVVGAIMWVCCKNFHFFDISMHGPVDTPAAMLANIVSFLPMARMFTNNINNFAQQIGFVMMGSAGAGRVFDLLDEPSEVDYGYVTLVNIKKHPDGTFEETTERTRDFAWKHPHSLGGITFTELKGDITLSDVDFEYVPGKLVLKNISIYAHPGQKIAFVGATGAGKTTITNLINRFYDIADGKIRYDGININKIKKSDLRRSLGIVLQDVNLFTGTVMDNIRYGRLDATDEECIEAAKIANAHDFITRLPEGYNTQLGGDGANLSQGQRQLISIARAAVANTPVMILDEATSSIDTRTEKLVQEGTDKLMEGRTVFVIAHRLSTVQNSNAIMVLDHGQIIERGTHEDLIKQKGVYYQLYTGAFELE